LERGRPGFTQDFTSLALLRIRLRFGHYAYGTITRSGRRFQVVLLASSLLNAVLQPRKVNFPVWAVTFSLAATNAISSISFPPATKMFQFTGSCFRVSGSWRLFHGVAPFGHIGIIAPVQLPRSFRSLAHPSSPLRA